MSEKSIGIWGPKKKGNNDDHEDIVPQVIDPNKNPNTQEEQQAPAPTGRISGKIQNKKGKLVRQWGLLDVLLAFFAFLFVQVALAVAVIVYAVAQVFGSGQDFNSTTLVTDSVLDRVYDILLSGPGIFLSSIVMYATWIFFAYRASYAHGARSFAKDFALKIKWKTDVLLGLLLAAILFGLSTGLEHLFGALGVDMTHAGNTETITNLNGIWFFISAFLVASILAPTFEEIFFRGFFMRGALKNFESGNAIQPKTGFGRSVELYANPLFKLYAAFKQELYRHRKVYAVVLSSIVFGLMHLQGFDYVGQWLVVPVMTGSLGLILAIVSLKTNRLGINIFGHVFYNLTGVIIAYLATR